MVWINNIRFQLLTNINIACFVILPIIMLAWSRICLSQHNLARYIWFSAIEIRQCYYIIISPIRMYTGDIVVQSSLPCDVSLRVHLTILTITKKSLLLLRLICILMAMRI